MLKEWRLGSEVWHEGRKLGVQDLHLLIGVLQEHKELNIGTIRLYPNYFRNPSPDSMLSSTKAGNLRFRRGGLR